MKRQMLVGGLMLAALVPGSACAVAGPWEDGMAAYNRGDYVPAIRLFRALAEGGNAKAQGKLGEMYRRGKGVARNSLRAFVWLTRAAAAGDVDAKSELREMSQSMTAEELARARAMARACEASNYRSCEY
jgi:TPR repeat protein